MSDAGGDDDDAGFGWKRVTVGGRGRVVPIGPGLVNIDGVTVGVDLEPGEVDRAQAIWIKIMRESGLPPELAYACEQTGMIVTKTNRHLFTVPELTEWEDTVRDYRTRLGGVPASP